MRVIDNDLSTKIGIVFVGTLMGLAILVAGVIMVDEVTAKPPVSEPFTPFRTNVHEADIMVRYAVMLKYITGRNGIVAWAVSEKSKYMLVKGTWVKLGNPNSIAI